MDEQFDAGQGYPGSSPIRQKVESRKRCRCRTSWCPRQIYLTVVLCLAAALYTLHLMTDSYYSYQNYLEGVRIAGQLNSYVSADSTQDGQDSTEGHRQKFDFGLSVPGDHVINIQHTFQKQSDSSAITFYEQRNRTV